MFRKWIMVLLLLTVGTGVIQAYDSEAHSTSDTTRISFYLKADASGIQQIYQQLLDGQAEARQISHAASNVLTFGVAYDGLSVAYVSEGQLWLQPIHMEEAEALTKVSALQFFHSPVFSPDGQYIAYADNGLWLLDLGTRETHELLANVEVNADGSNMSEFRLYAPEKFVMDKDGKASKLVVNVGIWEWNTAGIYDLESGNFQMLEGQMHTDLLPLSDGRVLLYGNTAVSGEPVLHIADSLDDINNYTEVLKFGSVTSATLFAEQAVELQPGVVRVFGQSMGAFPDQVKTFILDYDLNTNIVGQVHMTFIQNSSQNPINLGTLSPDGKLLPVHQDVQYTDAGTPYGNVSLVELGADTVTPVDGTVGLFQWQE
ncbi:MAG: hypothetical protein GC179_15365 [Anaerolineaceae bacterium]|nr:hypothetical protein [Anaerolineaceae bacterium]